MITSLDTRLIPLLMRSTDERLKMSRLHYFVALCTVVINLGKFVVKLDLCGKKDLNRLSENRLHTNIN